MFRFYGPRYPRWRYYRHRRHIGLGRQLLWGLLFGPWLFRKAMMRWGAYDRHGYGGWRGGYGGYGGYGGGPRGGWYGGPRGGYGGYGHHHGHHVHHDTDYF